MLVISAPTDALEVALVRLGAVARSEIPGWEPYIESIVVVRSADSKDVHLALGIDCDVENIETVWFERIRPFEVNLRTEQRAPRRGNPELASYNPQWPNQANLLIERLRTATGFVHRIDHIGSTSVPGLPAKDLIDIQVVVNDLAAAHQSAKSVRRAGFVHVEGDWYGTDRDGVQFREEVAVDADPGRPVNVNFRQLSDSVWKETLLFRDFLRSNATERDRYAEMKRSLESQGLDVDRYGELKIPYIKEVLMRADLRPF